MAAPIVRTVETGGRYCLVVFALVAACGGGTEQSTPPAPPAGGGGPGSSSATPAPGSATPQPVPAAAGALHGRRLYVGNAREAPLAVALGAMRIDVAPWQVVMVAPPEGQHQLEGLRFEVARRSDRLLVYNPGKAGRYTLTELLYGSDMPERPKTVETIAGEVLFARRVHYGLGQAFPHAVRDEPYRFKLAKQWGASVDLGQALGFLATERRLIDPGGNLVTLAYGQLEAHPDDQRVWAIVLNGVKGLQPSRYVERVVLARYASDPATTRAAIVAQGECGARSSLLARMNAIDRGPREKLASEGDLEALLEMPELLGRHAPALDRALGTGVLAPEQLDAVRRRFETADETDRAHLATYFLKVYRGDLGTLAAWAYGQPRQASRAMAWYRMAGAAGDVEAVLALLAAAGERSAKDASEARRVVASVAVGASADSARRATTALIAAAKAAPEQERAERLSELSTALVHATKDQPGPAASAALLGTFASELLGAKDAGVRRDAGALVATVVQHTRDKRLVDRLERAATQETDPEVKAVLEQRVRYLRTVVER